LFVIPLSEVEWGDLLLPGAPCPLLGHRFTAPTSSTTTILFLPPQPTLASERSAEAIEFFPLFSSFTFFFCHFLPKNLMSSPKTT
jgi:hypothetical protein